MTKEKKNLKKYGRASLEVSDTYEDIMDLDPFERWILGKRKERGKKNES